MSNSNLNGTVFLIGILVLVLDFGYFLFTCDEYMGRDKKNPYLKYIVIAILGLFLIGFEFYGEYKLKKSPWEYSEPNAIETIVCLQDNNNVNGYTSLHRGYINEELWYQYMVNIGNGGHVANKVKANSAIIYYDDKNPRVEWRKKKKKWFIFEYEETYHNIYIPNGSIIEDYNIDLR